MPGSFPFGAHADNVNQQFSMLGVVGTLGTADVGGTAKTLPVGIDPSTGAIYVNNLGAGGSGGSQYAELGTVGTATGNAIVFREEGGTLRAVGTQFPLPVEILSGTTHLNQSGGNLLVNVQNFAIGQFGNSDAVQANLTSALDFSQPMVYNRAAGSWDRMTDANGDNGGTGVGLLGVGLLGIDSGGTWHAIKTDTSGFITPKLNPIPTIGIQTYGTLGTTGAAMVGTLVGGTGSGAGTEIFVTSVSLSIPSTGGSQDVSIGWGTAAGTYHSGTASIVRGNFPPGGGIQKEFIPPINSGTNAQLGFFIGGAGTVDINVTYFITPSTL